MGTSSMIFEKHKEVLTGASEQNIAHNARRTAVYTVIYMLAGLLVSWMLTLISGPDFSLYSLKIIYVSAFLLIGVSHIFYFPKWLLHLHQRNSMTGPLYSLLLAALTGIVNFFFFTLVTFLKPPIALAGAFSFLLPFAVQQCWYFFDRVDGEEVEDAPQWMLPTGMQPQKKATIFLNSLQVMIRLRMNYFDVEENSFLITTPGRLQLGNIFHQFLEDKSAEAIHIQLYDQHQRAFAWKFSLLKKLGSRILNPEISLLENKIHQNDIILAERIKTS